MNVIKFNLVLYNIWLWFIILAEKEKDNKDVCSFFPEVKSVLKEIKLDDVTLESSPTSVYDKERNEGKVVTLVIITATQVLLSYTDLIFLPKPDLFIIYGLIRSCTLKCLFFGIW